MLLKFLAIFMVIITTIFLEIFDTDTQLLVHALSIKHLILIFSKIIGKRLSAIHT